MTKGEQTEARGTFACPICGYDKPHHHPDNQVAAYREDQMRNDGWISTTHRNPRESGWYLCLGVDVPADQYGTSRGIGDNPRWSQLSWFKWVRDAAVHAAGAHYVSEAELQEVLFFDDRPGAAVRGWRLRNFLGDATPSGVETRRAVWAQPTFWRELPAPPKRHRHAR